MQIVLDSPADHLLVNRVELISGMVTGVRGEGTLEARCSDREVLLRPCLHPRALARSDVQGFYGFILVQEHLEAIADGYLAIDVAWDGATLPPVVMRVSPVARHLAHRYPLDLAQYSVPAAARRSQPARLVFPGLGGVGGASLNQLMRRTMAREGRPITAYFEADDGPTWSRVLAAGAPEYGWVDGHACYGAADDLGPGSARVTLLREPVRRLVSVFHYNALVHPMQFPFATLEEFAESEAARGFTQAAGLARCAGYAIEGLPDADVGAIAERELAQSYAVVGTTERFEETIFLLCVLAGLDAIGMWWRILAAPKAVDVEQLPARLRARLEEVVEYDLRLYDRVETALSERVASCGFGDALVRYKEAAAREPSLSDHDKFVECLRWRQVLAEAELAACRPR